MKKVESARNSIQARENPIYLAYAQEGGLSRLQDVDEDELLKAIQRLPNKQCASDPIPTWLLKEISGMILPFVKSMVNQSFSEGIVPKSWKSAQVTPLLKKPSLDHNVASSYRPISNLPVLSKLSERLVLSRVMSYLNNSNLLPTHQSAYRRHHSTETAVTKVYSDILGAADDGKLSLLILLDLSAAFDLVDHSILLKRLESTYGFDGLTLEWFKNYLSERSFNVRCSGTKSDFVDSSVGVPQGSVLGPLLFSLYTGDLERIVLKYKLGFHQYADDTQIYGHCNNEGTEELQIRVSECVDEIASWMGANCLKLNSEKTEVIWFSSRRNLKNIPSYSVRVLESNIFPSKSVRNLGISMDRDLTMSTQISKTIQMCFTSLRQIRSIKGCLTMDSLKTLASALVLSRIDYGNMALVSLPKVATQSIQSIINTTARLITGVRKYDHITPVLKELHWLKIDERIEYKVALQMYKCLSNEGPAYLTRDLVPVASLPEKQRLRSAKSKDVVPNKHKLKSLGLRRFSVSGPKLWNNLPNSLKSSSSTKSFCRSLKTYLFNKSFPPS